MKRIEREILCYSAHEVHMGSTIALNNWFVFAVNITLQEVVTPPSLVDHRCMCCPCHPPTLHHGTTLKNMPSGAVDVPWLLHLCCPSPHTFPDMTQGYFTSTEKYSLKETLPPKELFVKATFLGNTSSRKFFH